MRAEKIIRKFLYEIRQLLDDELSLSIALKFSHKLWDGYPHATSCHHARKPAPAAGARACDRLRRAGRSPNLIQPDPSAKSSA